MNLMDSLKNMQTQRASQPLPGAAANLRSMLGAKSGKAGAISGPAASSVQEQQALADASAAATQQQQAGQLNVAQQEQQAAGIQQQRAQQAQSTTQDRTLIDQKHDQALTKIDNDLKRLDKDIESKEGLQALQDLIFARRMNDKQYLTDLDREGKVRRLENAQDFQLEAGKAAFENMQELFKDETEFRHMLEMDDAQFDKELLRMSGAAAMQVIATNAAAANKQAQYKSYGDMANTLVQTGSKDYTTTDAAGKETEASFFDRIGSGQDFTSTPAPVYGPENRPADGFTMRERIK